jgi:hypothetical protein
MSFGRNLCLSIIIVIPLFSNIDNIQEKKAVPAANQITAKYGALAIDRGNGFYFGWAADCSTLAEAEKKAIENCNKRGGRCTVVLSYSGTCCASYRFITGNVGMGYGWGIAKTKEEADAKAKKECAERSYGLPAPNVVFSCNSPNSGELREIYNAHDELKGLRPGTKTNY